MEYFKLLNLDKEPFSNSPDPDYFFKSRQHNECLQKLELSLRLRRGLNVVIGEVGTGKTTLCRQMIKKFSRDEEFETHLILDPHMADPAVFLKYVAQMFERETDVSTGDGADYKEFIKQYLYKRGVEENRVVVLIIDEGQKIPVPILEILRELLNYETNEYKLLQIVIFAQREFELILDQHANFADRINLLHVLGPLSFKDTRLMIDYRLQKAGAEGNLASMLSFPALVAIYRATGGYPRKIVNLCHRIMLAMIVKNHKRAGWRLVRSCIPPTAAKKVSGRWQKAAGALLVVIGVVGIAYTGFTPETAVPEKETAARQSFPIEQPTMPAATPGAGAQPGTNAAPKDERVAVKVETAGAEVAANKTNDIPDVTQNTTEPAAPANAEPAKAPPTVELAKAPPTAEAAKAPPTAEAAKAPPIGTPDEKADAGDLPKAAAALAAAARTRPQSLGMIRMRDNETLSWVIIKVYGKYNNTRRRKVVAGNPDLHDLDNILAGQAIGFPATPAEGLYIPDYLNWIRVGRLETVSAALDLIRQHSTRAAPLRIIPYWHKDQGLQFDVIFWKYFSSHNEAARYLTTLPADLLTRSEILTEWPEGIVFYANPCPGIG